MNLHKYTLSDLKNAIIDNISMRQVLITLKVAPYGGNYDTLRKAIKHFELDTSHFTGQHQAKGKTFQPKRHIDDYLSNKFPMKSYCLKLRLLKEQIFTPICSSCQNTIWMNKPIPLELDHINGNNKDNSLSNLRLLCPNCHAQTDTYRGKNQKRRKNIKS